MSETFDLNDPEQRRVARLILSAAAMHAFLSNPQETAAAAAKQSLAGKSVLPVIAAASVAAADELLKALEPDKGT